MRSKTDFKKNLTILEYVGIYNKCIDVCFTKKITLLS